MVKVNIAEGELAIPGSPVVQLLGDTKYQIASNIPETDISNVGIDDIVNITFDALSSSEIFTANVIEIDPDATIIQGVIYYKITIELDEDDERIKTGMTANLDIVTDEILDVLRVPIRAVRTDETEEYIEVLKLGVVDKRDVTVGFKGDRYYEIISGISEGEEVITYTQEK